MANNLLTWDVESGTIVSKFPAYAGNGIVGISTNQAFSGTKSLYYSQNAGGPGTRDGTDNTNPVQINFASVIPEVYLKWRWYIPSTLSAHSSAPGEHGFRLYGSIAQTDTQFDTIFQGTSPPNWSIDLFDSSSSPTVDSGSAHHNLTQFPTDQWFLFELRAVINTIGSANGILQVWVNGSLIVNKSNVTYRGSGSTSTGFKVFKLATNYDTNTSGDWWNYDDIEIWDGVPSSSGGSTANRVLFAMA